MQKPSYSKPQLGHLFHFTPPNVPFYLFYKIERRFPIFLIRNEMAEERFLFEGAPGNRSSRDGVGPVAQKD